MAYSVAQAKAEPPGDEAFLRDHRPGETWYLTDAERAQLAEVGDASRPPAQAAPAGTFARQLFERLLIDLAWSSSRLEGNARTRQDTQSGWRQGDELNRVELLRDLFVWAYERFARQYQIVRDSVPTPDPIRLPAGDLGVAAGCRANQPACIRPRWGRGVGSRGCAQQGP